MKHYDVLGLTQGEGLVHHTRQCHKYNHRVNAEVQHVGRDDIEGLLGLMESSSQVIGTAGGE